MKRYLALLWLLLPLPVVVLHFSHGQDWLEVDQARVLVREGELAEKRGDWATADKSFRDAAKLVATSEPDLKLRLDLAQIRTRFRTGEAVEAIDLSESLVNDPGFSSMPKSFRGEARELSGRIHYYAAWVMRLEGAQRELWMEEAELARQNYRMLAEEFSDSGDPERHQKDLESAVQLQRLSLTELMARPLPKEGQCMANQGLSEQMAKRRGQRGKQPGRGPSGDGPPKSGAGLDRFKPGSGS
ncbi:hypothetical protein [Haloferula rosea]|uniref:Tetratricopeptide repeat protein n=1 Tax=Haloferula rosea TaxID=490093 RepID=A0A934R879_9BACT|nr:hypothetical protein [Haloferula rosea]MBK1825700.1 hypothetical protein [Haloferula rosea]